LGDALPLRARATGLGQERAGAAGSLSRRAIDYLLDGRLEPLKGDRRNWLTIAGRPAV